MSYLESAQEILEAKEGEYVQSKEAKSRFDFGEAAKSSLPPFQKNSFSMIAVRSRMPACHMQP